MNTSQTEHQQKLQAEHQQIQEKMNLVKHQVMILSGKGGVGKSTVAVNLASLLAHEGKKVGLLDIDIHGPSIPKLFNLEKVALQTEGDILLPIDVSENLKVMSIGFLLPDTDDAVIWRGPRKNLMIKQFLKDVKWGKLDYLIIDSPPGTGDEPLSIAQFLGDADGAIIVTTPQEIALSDVRKGIKFCNMLQLPIIGVLENMSGFICPKCGEKTDIFKSGGGEKMAEKMNVPFLDRIPIDPQIVHVCDSGYTYKQDDNNPGAKIFSKTLTRLLKLDEK